jgi:hypothetical protein
MSDAKAIGPYKPNDAMLKFCKKIAATIWAKSEEIRHNKISLNDVEYCKGFHPLCDWCSYAKDCPKFTSVELDDPYYNDALAELEELKKQKSKLEDEIAVTERRIRDFYMNSGIQNDWLSTQNYRYKKRSEIYIKTLIFFNCVALCCCSNFKKFHSQAPDQR